MKNKPKDLRKKVKDCAIYSTDEGTNSWLLSDEQVDKIISTISRELLKRLPEEKEIRFEDLDTGIGIDRIEYSGQDREHGFNQALSDTKEIIRELLE